MSEPQDVMSIRQLARYLHVHFYVARSLVESKEIPARKIGATWKIPRRAVDAYRARASGQDPVAVFTVKDAADANGLPQWAVRSAIRTGVLPARLKRNRALISEPDLAAWIAAGFECDDAPPRRTGLPPATRFAVLRRDGFACQYCGRRAPDVVLHVDHRVSRAHGGTDEESNLVTACQECNLGKGSTDA